MMESGMMAGGTMGWLMLAIGLLVVLVLVLGVAALIKYLRD
jgi:hypothetical protein